MSPFFRPGGPRGAEIDQQKSSYFKIQNKLHRNLDYHVPGPEDEATRLQETFMGDLDDKATFVRDHCVINGQSNYYYLIKNLKRESINRFSVNSFNEIYASPALEPRSFEFDEQYMDQVLEQIADDINKVRRQL